MRDEDEKSNLSHFRTAERFFCQNGGWWFSTREGEEGPFDTREQAKAALERFVGSVQLSEQWQAEKEQRKAAARVENELVDRGVWDRQIDSN